MKAEMYFNQIVVKAHDEIPFSINTEKRSFILVLGKQ